MMEWEGGVMEWEVRKRDGMGIGRDGIGGEKWGRMKDKGTGVVECHQYTFSLGVSIEGTDVLRGWSCTEHALKDIMRDVK